MSRNLWSIAVLAAAFTLFLGTTDAEARHRRGHYRNHDCCQNRDYGHHHHGHHGYHQSVNYGYQQPANYGYGNCGPQQQMNYGWQQTNFVTTNTCGNPQPACCHVQPASTTSVVPEYIPAAQPPMESAATPAPVPSF